jgi:hypothetical protein
MSRAGRKPFFAVTDSHGDRLEVSPGLTHGKVRMVSKAAVSAERRVAVSLDPEDVRTLVTALEGWLEENT